MVRMWYLITFFHKILWQSDCVKSVRIRSFSGPYFPAFWLNMEIYGVNLRIKHECGKVRTRKTLNTDTFHAVSAFEVFPTLPRGVLGLCQISMIELCCKNSDQLHHRCLKLSYYCKKINSSIRDVCKVLITPLVPLDLDLN